MRRLRSHFLILIALWLPWQAAAAWAMPVCAHAASVAREEARVAPEHCHHEQEQGAAPVAGFDCDNCGMCHLSCAGYLFGAARPIDLPRPGSVLLPLPVVAHRSFIGDPPRHPPRSFSC